MLGVVIALALAQSTIWLRNQRDLESSQVVEIDCIGPGVRCRLDRSTGQSVGVIFVDGGSAEMRAAGALYVDGGYVLCANASDTSPGCVSTGTQFFSGSKVYESVSSFIDTSYVLIPDPMTRVSLLSATGIGVGGAITPETAGSSLRLLGRRAPGDLAAGVQIENVTWNDGGTLFQVNSPYPCNSSQFAITPGGTFYGAASTPACSGTGNLDDGALVHSSGVSGATSMMASSPYYLTFKGSLGDNESAVEADGGMPYYDGGTWVGMHADGGTFYRYGGNHGDTTIRSSVARYGGLLFEVKNPLTGGSGDRVFQVGPYGGISNHSNLNRAQFQPCPGTVIITSLGQFQYGAQGGELMYAADTEHWYVCRAGGWKQLKDEDDP